MRSSCRTSAAPSSEPSIKLCKEEEEEEEAAAAASVAVAVAVAEMHLMHRKSL